MTQHYCKRHGRHRDWLDDGYGGLCCGQADPPGGTCLKSPAVYRTTGQRLCFIAGMMHSVADDIQRMDAERARSIRMEARWLFDVGDTMGGEGQ